MAAKNLETLKWQEAGSPIVVGFAEALLAFVGAVLFPSLLGIASMSMLAKNGYRAAFALGVFLLYFSDTLAGSSYLDVNQGFGGGAYQAALVVLMGVGVVSFFLWDRDAFSVSPTAAGLAVPFAVALALGIHGFGEGSAVASTAAGSTQSLLGTFGGAGVAGELGAVSSFVLHKGLEGAIVGACYFTLREKGDEDAGKVSRSIVLLVAAFSLPAVTGFALGYYLDFNATFAFALAVGASFYVAVRLAGALFSGGSPGDGYGMKTAAFLLAGFLMIYFAASLHA